MARHLRWAVFPAIVLVAGCGDNGDRCGDGTIDVDGVCRPGMVTTCGDGTKLENGQCVIDPGACQAGTVLIAGHCVDPTRVPTVDLEESPEPNGFAVAPGVEASSAPAGILALVLGQTFVIHGHITPFRDADGDGQLDPDVDTYAVTTTGPALLDISVDGVGGAQGAFFVTADPEGAVGAYERYGLNLTGDTSQRRVFLPAAGSYSIAIADTRSLALGKNPPAPAGSGGAAGGPDAEYYASITSEAIPIPRPILATEPVTTTAETLATDEVKIFQTTLGTGANVLRDVMTGAAAASVMLLVNGQLAGYSDETTAPAADAKLTIGGVPSGEPVLVIVDTVYNYGPAPEPFTLTIMRTDAGATAAGP
jgi:hypothetical protein